MFKERLKVEALSNFYCNVKSVEDSTQVDFNFLIVKCSNRFCLHTINNSHLLLNNAPMSNDSHWPPYYKDLCNLENHMKNHTSSPTDCWSDPPVILHSLNSQAWETVVKFKCGSYLFSITYIQGVDLADILSYILLIRILKRV